MELILKVPASRLEGAVYCDPGARLALALLDMTGPGRDALGVAWLPATHLNWVVRTARERARKEYDTQK